MRNIYKTEGHIYITEDSEIKEGDYILETDSNYINIASENYNQNNIDLKIILTTDKDLIKNGVQAIDDEFLEWFIKNPSCEFIEIKHFGTCCGNQLINQCVNCEKYNPVYKINILKEEPKTMLESLQEYLKNTSKEKVLEDWNEFQHLDEEGITVKEFLENQKQTDEKGRPLTYWGGLEENKQETLEEAAEKFYPPKTTDLMCSPKLVRDSFIAGAKWQQEQNKNLYSEEEAIQK